jgi:hypothetical protein
MKKRHLLAFSLCGFSSNAQLVKITPNNQYYTCEPGQCINISVTPTIINETTNYSVNSIPFAPQFPFTGGTVIAGTFDDIYSPAVTLPFDFGFYGTFNNQLIVGSNGLVSFNTDAANSYCPWAFTAHPPSQALPLNAIFGVYQDTNIEMPPVVNPEVQNVNYYLLDTGTNVSPNRVFVVNFNELPLYNCNNSVGLQTSQIVLREGTNTIEIYVKNRSVCWGWNNASGLIAVQNANGTLTAVPPGRTTGGWTATNEAWKFTPNGAPISPTFAWFENGSAIGTGSSVNICPSTSNNYTVTAQYSDTTIVSSTFDVPVIIDQTGTPSDISICSDAGPYTVDLTSNNEVVLNGGNADDYLISYHETYLSALYGHAGIQTPAAYIFANTNQTIYLRVENSLGYDCSHVKSFDIVVNPTPLAPSGVTNQTFTAGEKLANIEVTGENIQWYDLPAGGNLLPMNTLLVPEMTYYASQTVLGCESRLTANRLPVTVTQLLQTKAFSTADIRLYPNPANNILNVSFVENVDEITIHNVVGQRMIRKEQDSKEFTVAIGGLHSGTYFIKVKSANGIVVSKFIKK